MGRRERSIHPERTSIRPKYSCSAPSLPTPMRTGTRSRPMSVEPEAPPARAKLAERCGAPLLFVQSPLLCLATGCGTTGRTGAGAVARSQSRHHGKCHVPDSGRVPLARSLLAAASRDVWGQHLRAAMRCAAPRRRANHLSADDPQARPNAQLVLDAGPGGNCPRPGIDTIVGAFRRGIGPVALT